jgi:hypothetical protein
MSRTGLEAKLPWKCIPQAIHQQVDAALGAPVIRAERAWGGYGPTPTYRLLLAGGRRAFFKGTFHASNAFSKHALQIEERVYHDLGSMLGSWMPQLFAPLHHEDWHILLLEDLGPKSVPPWTPVKTRKIAYALADFHLSSLDSLPPAWLPRSDEELEQESWTRTIEESEQVMAWYGERFPLNNHAVDCSLAFWFTFFAARAWLPEVAELPRLRRFQRQQLAVLANWAARQWSFPLPEWTEKLLQ